MKDLQTEMTRTQKLGERLVQLYSKRAKLALDKYQQKVTQTVGGLQTDQGLKTPLDAWRAWGEYTVDAAQRAVLFLDTLRQRGNQWLAHEQAGKPPVLSFDYEMVLDARTFERPVNYALVRIVPPAGVQVDDRRRPYIVIDPRAGHGPGIGGFKDDSQVGVALRAGHPVYFVIFFPEPMPGQRLIDITEAEKRFVRKVRELHPASAKPALVGNCQGGWAAMMLAAADPELSGPIVVNGAPMSYWGGAWSGGEGDNPMRYSGGMLGGTWLASFACDLGNGVFDGASLVQNFENLNPANTFVNKYYTLFDKADTEPPRYLEFEKWWGGYYLLNKEEMEWITRNLFVGNKLWKGEVKSAAGEVFDLRKLKQPVVLFASMGDNITPPQQAFNWVADVYGSTEEIKACGQTIVGLVHADIGHLGIFVSGKVAKREHKEIVSVLKSIEALPPGLYAMHIAEGTGRDGAPQYEVSFEERRLEDVVKRLNRFERADEKPFEVVAALSEFNQRAYELFAQPVVQALATEAGAEAGRRFHPLRLERWSISDLNPWLWWVGPAAEAVKAQRQPVSPQQPLRQAEVAAAALASAGWDLYRDLRDAATEAAFFGTYGILLGHLADSAAAQGAPAGADGEAFVRQALERIEQGGFDAAVARTASLLARRGVAIDLDAIALKKELIADYRATLSPIDFATARRIRGEQDLIVANAPEAAVDTLPALLAKRADRERFERFWERVLSDSRVSPEMFTAEQKAMFDRIWARLKLPLPGRVKLERVRRAAPRKTIARKPARPAAARA